MSLPKSSLSTNRRAVLPDDVPVSPTSHVEVDLDALARNYSVVRRLSGARELIAAVKADAYGFGVHRIAPVLRELGVDALWSGDISEAVSLRSAGDVGRLLMFGGPLPEDIPTLVEHQITPTVHDVLSLRAVEDAARSRRERLSVYVKVDCGLGRLGVPLPNALEFLQGVTDSDAVWLAGVYSHLPFDSSQGLSWAREQALGFQSLLQELQRAQIPVEVTQLWGTAGVRNGLADSSSAVCVGQLLYGLGSEALSPHAPDAEITSTIRAMRSRIVQVRDSNSSLAGPIGAYSRGSTSRMGVIPLGTAAGLRAAVADRGAHVLVGGRRAAILGVSLEHCIVDLSDSTAEVGDSVTLIGQGGTASVTLEDWADWFGGSTAEVAAAFVGALPKVYS